MSNNTGFNGSVSLNADAKSPFWFVSFVGSDGRQRRRSTKVPVAGGLYKGERLTATQAKKRALLVGMALAAEVDEEFVSQDNRSVREVCDAMLAGKLGRVSAASYANARTAYTQFCGWLGVRASRPIREVSRAVMKDWVVFRRGQVRHKTVCKDLCFIRAAFEWAVDAEVMPKNPCAGLSVPPDSRDEKVVHEAFSLDELRVLVEKLPDEWASAVRCCLGTYGQRLGDVLSLRWEQFDWEADVVRLVSGKTARILVQPMLPWFRVWARARFEAASSLGGDAAVWVHPRLRLHSNPSAEFTGLVRLHGFGLAGSKGVGNRRVWHSKTFHSLRASVATLLQAAGVSQGIAMELVGHDSVAVHAAYVRPSLELLREAAGRLPVL